MSSAADLHWLTTTPRYAFRGWPNPVVPRVAAGVYAIWQRDRFLYVGMSGRSLSAAALEEAKTKGKNKGLYTRLNSHASGRRSGDQFCIYVCDRLVLPTLSATELTAIAGGQLSLDALTKTFIATHLDYRFVETHDGAAALAMETRIKSGASDIGRPWLNPAV